MYVKSLTLKGFKSFADATTLDLQSGVNVVVGPNGSGKSNVIDAVAWVLGAQGARALRGGKMDDVIFAGTARRGALGRAEVSLVIDNADGRIPVEFNEVTITRTLFRSGESEYAINNVPCRLLDIQELLSDSGVGRQQHVIVSQGNLDAVLTARPEDRRMIIEEAAGVLKHRKRREKAQRRLEATEQNLERIADLVREVRQQLRPLKKQAEAALRHDEVASELRNLKLYTTGRDIASLQHRFENADAEASELVERNKSLREELQEADAHVESAETEAAGISDEDLGSQVERLEGLFQRAKGISNVMTERRKTLESELSAQVSKDVVSQLENDAANVRTELVDVEHESASLQAPFEELMVKEQELAGRWLTFEEEWGDGLPVATNEAAGLRGEASALQKSLDGLDQDTLRRRERLGQLIQQVERLVNDAANAEIARQVAQEQHMLACGAVLEGQAGVDAAQNDLERTEAELRSAEQRHSVAGARVEALTSALDATRARAGVERLAGIDGITGTLAELVEVDEDFQAAFEAAAGEAMAAVVVDDLGAARESLARLREGDDDGGAVLVLNQTGHSLHVPHCEHADALRPHVRGRSAAVDALLDRVLCCCLVVDGEWHEAVDLALQYPDLVVVTRRGDRFSRGSWRIGSGGQGATMAAVEAAQHDALLAAAELSVKQEAAEKSREQRAAANDALALANKAISDAERRISQTIAAYEKAQSLRSGIDSERATIEANLSGLSDRKSEEALRLFEIEERLPDLEAAEASGEERARLWRDARSVLEDGSTHLRNERHELEVRKSSLEKRRDYLSERLVALEKRLEQHRVEVERAAERREAIWAKLASIDSLRVFVSSRIDIIERQLATTRTAREKLRARQREVNERLDSVRRRRSAIERELLQIAERRQNHEVHQAELRMRLEALAEVLEKELEADLASALAVDEPQITSGQTPKQRITDLERDLRQMGPINPLALEEFKQVEERHQFLDQQLHDVQESRRELVRVIRTVDNEIVEVFKGAYEDVSKHFEHLFGALFPGGAGKLRLTDPDNPLETGIEIEAKPSGKNVRTLSLLSGGERSLVALAFLFAVFRSRPSPFYLLDEVEAALDDMNLNRFLTLIDEFRGEAQLVIVSHQKRTMEKADCLYGVSMQPGGSSKVVSERVHVDLTSTPVAS